MKNGGLGDQDVRFRFPGRVALVTGGASGIGRAVVHLLMAAGAKIGLQDHPGREQEVKAGMSRMPTRQWVWCPGDIRGSEAAEEAVRRVMDRFGRMDIVVNCAGIASDHLLWEMGDFEWDTVVDVNLKGTFNVLRAAARVFRRQRSGTAVSISSINGLRGKAGQANYAASKAGVIGLTKSAAKELGRYGVTVNAVAPGWIDTPMTRKLPPFIRRRALEETAIRRVGAPEDVAAAVAFLCSSAASHITGHVLKVDGGQYI